MMVTPFIPLSSLDIDWGNKTHRGTQTELMQQQQTLLVFGAAWGQSWTTDLFSRSVGGITTVTTAALFTR